MSGCHMPNSETKLIYAGYDMLIDGIEVKTGDPILVKNNMPSQCTCKCHVATNECCYICRPELASQTITIKKALWDEMLSYKKRIEKLELQLKAMLENIHDEIDINVANRIEKLEKFNMPYKCPACDGSTLYRHKNDTYSLAIDCQACKGSGVIWN